MFLMSPGGAVAHMPLEHPAPRAVTVRFAGSDLIHRMPAGGTLREAAQALGLALGAGCAAGDCCGDLVRVLKGAEHLSPPGQEERSTLVRIGAAPDERLACRARVLGPVVAALSGAASADDGGIDGSLRARVDSRVERVIIVGNGVAGSTALARIAALSPACRVTVIGAEPYGFYNRMDIARLIETPQGADSLAYPAALLTAGRAPEQRINTLVRQIDPVARSVLLGTGERLDYDRLLLATGAAPARPPVPGAELAGCFRLRTAGDAIAIRSWLQCMPTAQAVVVGAGVLGLEAAEVLARFGVAVQVLESAAHPMPAQLLPAPAAAVAAGLARHRVRVRGGVRVAAIRGANDDAGRVGAVELTDGESIPAGLVLFCTGNRPNIALAQGAGLVCGQGICVDAQMRTSDPNIFAAGDVAQLHGQVTGLWEPARQQALAAADSMLGLAREWQPVPLPVRAKLKTVGLVTLGALPSAAARGAEILVDTAGGRSWRQLVLDAGGRVAAAAFVNAPRWVPEVEAAARDGRDLRPLLGPLRDGRWEVLRALEAAAA
jgi:NADPH-dependent 2,4-dienoyl-CoA reductase/sulfur reductase-like enzyme/ferredoxin